MNPFLIKYITLKAISGPRWSFKCRSPYDLADELAKSDDLEAAAESLVDDEQLSQCL